MTTQKLFVLDTNVLLHDPQSLFRFAEHDVYLPLITLEEMDAHKVGMSDVARNARQASRYIDQLFNHAPDALSSGIPLHLSGFKEAQGKLLLQTTLNIAPLPESLSDEKADNLILALVKYLHEHPNGYNDVALVSKDINIRLKARALGLPAEDYFNDKVLEDSDMLYSGYRQLDADFWLRNGSQLESWQEQGKAHYRIQGKDAQSLLHNELLLDQDDNKTLQARVVSIDNTQPSAILQTVKDYSHNKNSVFGITSRNWGQNYALNLLMNPDIDLVTLLGQAGTGKTLLTLAAALTQVLDQQLYNEIIMTRVTVPVGDDIGFLPGTEEEKMNPWMGALEDNLEVLTHSDDMGGAWARAATQDMVRNKIKVKSINFMRGRTFQHKFLIVDEAQNLTSKQMKTLITRAGEGTKIVCMGNLAQIDTPYLSEGSSGLTYLVDRFKNWPHFGHITLQQGERSRLAAHAVSVL
ncbi:MULTISPECIES: PhoH family protein [Vitreoscilla]|uniref:PhoH family protein n=1 Tax=Vitreoscilla stercoraria TaxID=61 RepID=A0ABY4EBI5_VITST|nr:MULTISPECIES: PhoH family protein [Vitreoscilla]AUZ04014.1 PhoH-like protein [Vitreoscilla sp. C1]UOO93112.1 PhoH family protein [Vitreoscilla stercoraria]